MYLSMRVVTWTHCGPIFFFLLLFQQCDAAAKVTCVDLDMFNADGRKESVCLQCPGNTSGDGRKCLGG